MTTAPPAPLEWHPAYRDQTWLLAWLEGRGGGYPDRMHIPIIPVVRIVCADEPDAMLDPIQRHILTRQRAVGPAPYVGRPFIYWWWTGIDELGRGIAGDARIRYADSDFTFCYGSFEYAQGARNGHDDDTPVWP